MIVKNSKKEKNTVTFDVELDAAEFEKYVNGAYLKARSRIMVPGFRKGKAPRMVIEGMYGKDVFYDDAFDNAANDAFAFGVAEGKLETVGRPTMTDSKVTEENGALLSFSTDVYPEVTLGQYKGLEAEKPSVEVTDEEVDGHIERLRKQNARLITVERPAQDGDTVNINYVGSVNNVEFTGGSAENYDLTLGSGTFIDGFEDQIIGHKPGETFDVNVTFPDGYSDSTDANGNTVTLSGQKAVFTVVLNYISESVLPELTDSWVASTFGTSNNIYTVEALRAYYQDQLYTSNLNTAVMDDLLENSTFKSIPQQVMDYQVNQCLNYYSTLAGYYGYDLDGLVQNLLGYENTDAMLAHLESNLEDYSKEALLYQAVAESLDIAPTQEQIDTYSAYADTYGQNYCTMVALMDAVTSTLTSGAVVS